LTHNCNCLPYPNKLFGKELLFLTKMNKKTDDNVTLKSLMGGVVR